jgi:hypothetical protein
MPLIGAKMRPRALANAEAKPKAEMDLDGIVEEPVVGALTRSEFSITAGTAREFAMRDIAGIVISPVSAPGRFVRGPTLIRSRGEIAVSSAGRPTVRAAIDLASDDMAETAVAATIRSGGDVVPSGL